MIRKNFLLSLTTGLLLMPSLAGAQAVSTADVRPSVDARSLLSAFAAYTDLRLASVQRSAEILAGSTEARSGQWARMKGLLAGYQGAEQGLIVWYVRPDGRYYTVDQGLVAASLRDRPYFPELMAGRRVDAALVISKSTGQRSAVIAVPVRQGNTLVGAIGVSLFLDRLSEQLGAALDLPPGVAFFAMAPDGLTTLHQRADRHFLDPRQLGSPSLRAAADAMLTGDAGMVRYEFDNATKQAIFQTSPRTRWKFALTFSPSGQK